MIQKSGSRGWDSVAHFWKSSRSWSRAFLLRSGVEGLFSHQDMTPNTIDWEPDSIARECYDCLYLHLRSRWWCKPPALLKSRGLIWPCPFWVPARMSWCFRLWKWVKGI